MIVMAHCTDVTRRSLLKWTTVAAGSGLLASSRRFESAAQEPFITLITGPSHDSFWFTIECGVHAAALELGLLVDPRYPQQFDATEQASLLADAVLEGPSAILVAPADRTAMIEPIRAAASSGIPIVTVDTIIDEPLAIAEVGSDNVLGGQMAVWALAELTGGTGSVFLSTTRPGISTTDDRQSGFEQALASYDFVSIGVEYNNNDASLAREQIDAVLDQHPDLTAIVATNLNGSLGAAEAILDRDMQGQVAVIGFDAGPTLVSALEQGIVSALIAQHPYDMGYSATYIAADFVHSGITPGQRQFTTDYSVVTAGNVDDPIIRRILYVEDCAEIPELAATPTA
ncbi:MAG: substrate-binding domain-containing protein [Thermomicrobiales bacterium]